MLMKISEIIHINNLKVAQITSTTPVSTYHP